MSVADGTRLAPPVKGKRITILSIDGGGIRGIIPAVLLQHLEKELQRIDGRPDARLAEYFDVIAGTSTGGLLTAMITTRKDDDPTKPLYAAKDLVPFYLTHGAKIFPESSMFNPLSWVQGKLFGPKYDGKYLHALIRKEIGDHLLTNTLTNVVIPTFDIKFLQPVIFNSFDARRDSTRNPKLSDVCISTSAAPIYLPPHCFEVQGKDGAKKEYHMVDGGACANNPTMVAVGAVSREITRGNKDFQSSVDYDRFLVISVGTGSDKSNGKYNAKEASQWGPPNWIYDLKTAGTPLIEVFMQGSSDMVDFHTSTVFHSANCLSNYLRIQYDSLTGDQALMDKSTKENLNNLVQVGMNLLKMPVSRINLHTGFADPIGNGKTNAEELTRFAEQLSAERKLRLETTA